MKKNISPRPARRKQSDRVTRAEDKSANKNYETWIPGIKDSELKKRLETDTKIGPEAFPPSKKKKGDSGVVFMRPPDDEQAHSRPRDPNNRLKTGAAPDDPCGGINFIEIPDIGVQLDLRPLNESCPSESDLRRIERSLAGQISRFSLPDPEIRAKCDNRVISIGIWPTRAGSGTCADIARNRAMRNLSLLQGNVFGFFLNASLITRLAARGFDAAPKRLSSKGNADPNGPIHLTRLMVVFGPKDNIDTIINGFDDRPWPDVGFSVTISDTINNNASCITTATKDISDRDIIFASLSFLALGRLSFFVPLLIPATLFALFNDLDSVLNRPDGPQEGGVGCKILQTVPQEVPLPSLRKLVIIYQRAEVKPGGLFFGATVFGGARHPAGRIVGPSRLVVHEDASETQAIYHVVGSDTFGGLTVRWSSVGNVIDNPNVIRTRIHFPRGERRAGDSFQRTINVTMADEDGALLNASFVVTVTVVEPDDTLPICRAKPWLPVCQKGMGEP